MLAIAKPKPTDEATAVRFGRYTVIQQLGAGGMATVYLALLPGNTPSENRLVALKQSHGGISRSAQWKEALREAHCGKSIHHPNVVRVLEVGDGAQGPYIVMEYVEGGSLLGLLTEGVGTDGKARKIPVAIACRVIVDTLRGLHAAHDARDATGNPLGLIHRDVSPHNVLVGVDGVARLADFGIARLVQLSNTAPGLVRGKAGYVAPEQATGRPTDRRADIFSMGVVLWECLSGRRLFKGANQDDTLQRIVSQPATPIHLLVPEVPESISAICARLLAKSPENRPSTALEVANALEDAARNAGVFASHSEVADEVLLRLRTTLERRVALLAEWCFVSGVPGTLAISRVTELSRTLPSRGAPTAPTAPPAPTSDPALSRPISAIRPRSSYPELAQLSRSPSGTDWLSEVSPSSPVPGPSSVRPVPLRDASTEPLTEPLPESVAARSKIWVPFVCVAAIASAWACGYVCADPTRALDGVSSIVARFHSPAVKTK